MNYTLAINEMQNGAFVWQLKGYGRIQNISRMLCKKNRLNIFTSLCLSVWYSRTILSRFCFCRVRESILCCNVVFSSSRYLVLSWDSDNPRAWSLCDSSCSDILKVQGQLLKSTVFYWLRKDNYRLKLLCEMSHVGWWSLSWAKAFINT